MRSSNPHLERTDQNRKQTPRSSCYYRKKPVSTHHRASLAHLPQQKRPRRIYGQLWKEW
jgi:hypothetical protein